MAFFLLFLSLVLASGVLVLEGLVHPAAAVWPWLYPVHVALYGAALLSLFFVIQGRMRTGQDRESRLRFWVNAYFPTFLGFHSLLFIALLAYEFALAFLSMAHAFWNPSFIALFFLLAAYFLAILGVIAALAWPKLERISLGDGTFKILQISDLHIGPGIGENYVRKTVEIAQSCKPDCIVLTGDIGDGDPSHHSGALRELAKLSAPLGVFVVLGNHELYMFTEAWAETYRKMGMILLQDEVQELTGAGKGIRILGLRPMRGKSVSEILGTAGAKKSDPLIVLSHYPSRAKEAAAAGARLFLAGHTHGGQFWPWTWVIHAFHRHAKGLYRVGDTSVYVSRGTGYWGAPLRFGARAEITLLECDFG